MCATTCAGLENCLIKRQRGEPVSDIISENYPPFKAFRFEALPKPNHICQCGPERMGSTKLWCCNQCGKRHEEFYKGEFERVSGEAKTPDQQIQHIKDVLNDGDIKLALHLLNEFGGPVPTKVDPKKVITKHPILIREDRSEPTDEDTNNAAMELTRRMSKSEYELCEPPTAFKAGVKWVKEWFRGSVPTPSDEEPNNTEIHVPQDQVLQEYKMQTEVSNVWVWLEKNFTMSRKV